MKSSRSLVESRCVQNASTLGVWRRSSPKISSRSPQTLEVGLPRVPGRGVAREARRDDQLGACPQQLDPGLVADLHAAAGEQRDAAGQVGGLRPLAEVEVAAGPAELVVEGVQLDVVLLADVAVLRRDRLAELGIVLHFDLLEPGGWEHVRRRVDRLVAQDADAGLGEHRLVAAEPGRLLLAPHDLVEPPSLDDVRVVDVAGRSQQPRPLLERQRLEQAPVADDRFEHLGGGLQPLDDVVLRRRWSRLVLTDGHRGRVATNVLAYARVDRPAGKRGAFASASSMVATIASGSAPFSR